MDAAIEEAVDHDAIFGGRNGNSFIFDRYGVGVREYVKVHLPMML